MIASGCPSNHVLKMLDAADLDLLRPHLATLEMVRESVLSEAGTERGRRLQWSDNLSQLPIYPDMNMMDPTKGAGVMSPIDSVVRERRQLLETMVRSANGFLSALSADDYESIRPF